MIPLLLCVSITRRVYATVSSHKLQIVRCRLSSNCLVARLKPHTDEAFIGAKEIAFFQGELPFGSNSDGDLSAPCSGRILPWCKSCYAHIHNFLFSFSASAIKNSDSQPVTTGPIQRNSASLVNIGQIRRTSPVPICIAVLSWVVSSEPTQMYRDLRVCHRSNARIFLEEQKGG